MVMELWHARWKEKVIYPDEVEDDVGGPWTLVRAEEVKKSRGPNMTARSQYYGLWALVVGLVDGHL